jgi:serine/threonine protein kinase
MLEQMKGDSHIVSYEDHYVEKSEDGLKWTIYIRMELLKSLVSYITEETYVLGEREVIRLGMDICKGLETCQKFNVVHRDIKMENIFVSNIGHYKLGDFGISKVMEQSENTGSQKGTKLYMAPEMLRGEKYDATVDIYSLGIVLYRLLNHNRAPFLPLYPQEIRVQDKEEALQKRLNGEVMPAPCNADEALAKIIQKACSFRPEDRYQSPRQMRLELEKLLEKEKKNIPFDGNEIEEEYSETVCVQEGDIHSLVYGGNRSHNRKYMAAYETGKKSQSVGWKNISLLLVVICCIIFAIRSKKDWLTAVYEPPLGESVSMEQPFGVGQRCGSGFEYGVEIAEREHEKYWTKVPEVTGLEETKAVEKLVLSGFEKDHIHSIYEYDAAVEKGTVISQDTPKDESVKKTDEITITVSLGPKPVPVTDKKEKSDESGWIWKSID